MTAPLAAPDVLRTRGLGAQQNLVKAQLDRAQTELTTGRRLDLDEATGGDVSRVTAIDRSIAAIDSRLPLIGLARQRAEVTQDALEAVQGLAKDVGLNLVNDVTVGDVGTAVITAREARDRLEAMLGALNVTFAGRPLFGGAQADVLPMGGADALIGFVRAALDAYPDVDDALLAVDDFFDPPDPLVRLTTYPGPETFDADFFRGTVDAVSPPVELAPGERVDYAVRGDAAAIKNLLKNMAVTAATQGSAFFSDNTPERTALFSAVGRRLIEGDDDMAVLRAELGLAQARIERGETRAVAERTTLGVARNEMTGIDDFETATRVTELETRLQMLYEITARLSRLSFINFMR